MNSIRRTLLVWLLAGVLAAIAVTAGLVYFQARREANELSDTQMKQLVASMPQSPGPIAATRDGDASTQDDFVVQVWDSSNGFRLYNSHEQASGLPQKKDLGFFDVSVDGVDWRIYNAKLGATIVQVAQLASARHQVAAQVALRTVTPLLFLLPFLSLLIWITVGKSLKAVRRVAAHVQSRDASSLPAIPDQELPREIQPLTHAFNDLLARLRLAITAQRAFIADAAHELKTPLTALQLQMQLAQRAKSEQDRQAAFADLKGGLERANHLVQQLLTLARQDPGAYEPVREPLDIAALARSVATDFTPLADDKQIRLGMAEAATPATISGNAEALRIMLNNLVDNAIRYTPQGGRVDLAVEQGEGQVRLSVDDSGPGIPDRDLNRVLDRFYRVPGTPSKGSGLGLAIVKQIADAHGARITLSNTGNGLRVYISFEQH